MRRRLCAAQARGRARSLMLHEERMLAEPSAIDEHGHVDQMTG
jgi:hypothetical protein